MYRIFILYFQTLTQEQRKQCLISLHRQALHCMLWRIKPQQSILCLLSSKAEGQRESTRQTNTAINRGHYQSGTA